VAAARPATRRERGERVRAAAWSCCGDACSHGAGPGPWPARSSRFAAAAAISASVAVAAYRASVQDGMPISERKLAEMFGKASRRWARSRMAEARQSLAPA
jgi:hypothetical protein